MSALKTLTLLLALGGYQLAHAEQPLKSNELSPLELARGIEIFQFHCARCHGKTAEGDGRFAVIYRRLHSNLPSNFTMGYFASRPADYLKTIIENGGEANKRSKYMPPFQDALSSVEIDLLARLIQKTGADRRFP